MPETTKNTRRKRKSESETPSDNLTDALYKLADHLARRDHSRLELWQKLTPKFEPETVEEALHRAEENGWLLDETELAQKVANQLDRRGKGILYIRQYLNQKGLPAVDRDEATEHEKAASALEQKWGNYDSLSFEQKKKSYTFLKSRGFEGPVIKKVIYD